MKILLSVILLLGCINYASAQEHDNVIENPGIPPDFYTVKSHILVILYDKNSEIPKYEHKLFYKQASEAIQENFPKYYTGDFDFVTMSTDIDEDEDITLHLYDHDKFNFAITNPAYKNADTFRFVLYYITLMSSQPILGMYDRKTKKSYTVGGQYPLIGKWYIDGYANKLESIRPK